MKIKEIIKQLQVIKFIGNQNTDITTVSELGKSSYSNTEIIWLSSENSHEIVNLHNVTIICVEKVHDYAVNPSCNLLIVENPRKTFKEVLDLIYPTPNFEHFISSSAIVHPSVKIQIPVYVGHNTIIEENCIIKQNTRIGHNNVVLSNTLIDENVTIGNNCTIGGVGFGYVKNEHGENEVIKHVGGVKIESFVEIGNNVCIDRSVIGNTSIGHNVKIDNLVHIAHGVVIGKNSLIIANSMIGGSTIIGENVWVAPSSSIKNKIKVANDSLIGLGAVVIKNVEENSIVVGNPAKKIENR